LQEIEEKRRLKEEEVARRKETARQQRSGEAVTDTLESDEDALEVDLSDGGSDNEDSMQVVRLLRSITGTRKFLTVFSG
jgi:hypothetical protein